jgi:hypothetical protein
MVRVRNIAILLTVIFVIVFFTVPFVDVTSVNLGILNESVVGSLSYALFHCGEVHVTRSTIGVSTNQYEFVCGNQNP